MPRDDDRALTWIITALAIASAAALIRIVQIIPLHVPLDRNEGWNAYQTIAAISGNLYPRSPRFFFNNYPPLSFYIVGELQPLIGDAIVTGRTIAAAAFAALAVMLAVAARRMHCSRREAMFGAALFVAVTLASSHYVGVDDPQFPGQAVSVAGLLVLLRDRPALLCPARKMSANVELGTLGHPLGAAMLMTIGVFIKHNIVALPIASALWLTLRDRRAGRRFVAAGVVLGVAALAICALAFGPGFFEGLSTPRAYSVPTALFAFVRWIVRVPVFMLALVLLLRDCPDDPAVGFCSLYAVVASATGLIFLGGDGVDWNVMFESNWAFSLMAAVAVNRLHIRRQLAVGFVLLPAIAAAAATWRSRVEPRSSLAWRVAAAHEFQREIAFIEATSGPALCEDLALCYWAGKDAELDAFNFAQHVKRGTRRSTEVADLIDQCRYAAVQVSDTEPLLDRTTVNGLRRRYMIGWRGPSGEIWVPRRR